MRPARATLVYDGECAFCRRWIERWRARTGDRVVYAPLQRRRLLRRLGVSPVDARRAVQLVEPDGRRSRGARAVFRLLARTEGHHPLARALQLPLVRTLADLVYRAVARHRPLASRLDRLLFGRAAAPPSTRRVRQLFLRGLGLVYLVAFSSLRRELPGLFGSRGIVPLAAALARVRAELPAAQRWRAAPSLLWLDASDRRLDRLCGLGQLCGLMLALGLERRLAATLAWALYLSFVAVGDPFLQYQWDALLVEAGLDALLLAQLPDDAETPAPARLLMRALAFRLHFESGLCKLQSRDPSWRDLTACAHHHETQPLPTELAWWAHQLPRPVHRLATALTLAVELAAPWAAFLPRRARHLGFGLLMTLQALIQATGSFGFFNLLTAFVSLWLLDDSALGLSRRARAAPRHRGRRRSRARRAVATRALVASSARRLIVGAAAASLAMLQAAEVAARLGRLHWPRLVAALRRASRLRAIASYGLFAVMTCRRLEIVVEGSDDGVTWREYQFRYKPGDVNRPPRAAAPHQPRLDWQMWFAALSTPPLWLVRFLAGLLEGRREILQLLLFNPFPMYPPRYIRALLYDYQMTDLPTRRATGAWWRREPLGTYFPACTL